MQKVIGGILILSATAGAGVVYGNELKRYLRNMVYLRYVFGLIRGEIEYTCAPLPEIFFGVSARVKEPYRRWLKKTAEETYQGLRGYGTDVRTSIWKYRD